LYALYFCCGCEKEVVLVLVGYGSDVCALDCDGLLPLTHAAIHGQVSLALKKDM
jgi:ankyrin repeat protein